MPGSPLASLALVAAAGGWKNSRSGPGALPGWFVSTLAHTPLHHPCIWPPASAVHRQPLLQSLGPCPENVSPPNPRREVLSPILVMGGPCVAGESGPWGFFLFNLLHVWVPQPQVVGSGFKAANSLSLRKMKLPLELTLSV